MSRKGTDYSKPDTSAWQNRIDDLFLAQFRGRPCKICGAMRREYNGRMTRSMGHHLMEKDLHRIHRYSVENIIILCAKHHGQHERSISPHSNDTVAVAAFYEWVRLNEPEQWEWFKSHCRDEWDGSWTYKEMYQTLGGEITDEKFKKDQKPLNHAEKIRIAERHRSGNYE